MRVCVCLCGAQKVTAHTVADTVTVTVTVAVAVSV